MKKDYLFKVICLWVCILCILILFILIVYSKLKFDGFDGSFFSIVFNFDVYVYRVNLYGN